MADVVICEMPEEIPDTEKVAGLEVNFEEYAPMVHYDMIPLWNVWHLKLESTGFPIPCGDYKILSISSPSRTMEQSTRIWWAKSPVSEMCGKTGTAC